MAIGPHLKNCHFEVTEEFLEHFDSSYFDQKAGKYYFNPTQVVHIQLQDAGFLPENITDQSRCTYCETDYYSYRREGKTGRQIGFIGLP